MADVIICGRSKCRMSRTAVAFSTSQRGLRRQIEARLPGSGRGLWIFGEWSAASLGRLPPRLPRKKKKTLNVPMICKGPSQLEHRPLTAFPCSHGEEQRGDAWGAEDEGSVSRK